MNMVKAIGILLCMAAALGTVSCVQATDPSPEVEGNEAEPQSEEASEIEHLLIEDFK